MRAIARALVCISLLSPNTVAGRRSLLGPSMSDAAFLEKYGTVLDRDVTYYRWQSTTSGENLVGQGTLNEATNRYFMGLTRRAVAGPGIYLASDALSSDEYLPLDGGNLVEVRIAKGTPLLDLTDDRVIQALDVSPHPEGELPETSARCPPAGGALHQGLVRRQRSDRPRVVSNVPRPRTIGRGRGAHADLRHAAQLA